MVSNSGQELKQLKNDTYAMIGKMRKEIGVDISTSNWEKEEMEGLVEQSSPLQGVLCYQGSSLDLDEYWKKSASFIHFTAKTFIPSLLLRCKGSIPPFFIIANSSDTSPNFKIIKPAVDALLRHLETPGLNIGYADNLLEKDHRPQLSIHTPSYVTTDESIFQAGESPTKLWNMWALQDENNLQE
jgi:hypothetical protein